MADIKIDREQFTKLEGWAKDETLRSLLAATQTSNSLLKAIGGKRTSNLDIGNQIQRGVVDPLKQGTEDTVEGLRSLKASVKDLEETQWRASGKINTFLNKVDTASKDASKLLPELLQSGTSKAFAGLGAVAGKFGAKGKIIAGLGAVLGSASAKAAERFLEAADAFRPMIQSGLTFGGSIDQMVSSVRGANVSFEAAGRIVEQQGAALVAVGEKNFFAATDRMGATFKRLALTGDQGAEIQAELTDQMRTTGSLFNMTQEQYTGALENSLRLMQQQNILTGKSVKQQLAERKKVAERTSFQALIASQGPEEQERLTNWFHTLVETMKMSQEDAMGVLLQSQGVGGTTGYARADLSTGGAVGEIVSRIQAGSTALEEGSLGAMQNAMKAQQTFLEKYGTTGALAMEKGMNNLFTQTIASAAEGARAGKGIGAVLGDPEKAEQVRKAQEGVDILGKKTQFMYDTLFDISKTIAKAEASTFEIVSAGIDKVLASIIKAADQINAKGILETAQGIAAMPGAQSLGAAAAGAAGLAVAPKLLGLGGGAAGGAGAAGSTSMLGKAASGAMKLGGKVLGLEQLISAGTSIVAGNYAEAAGHMALFALKKNPVGMLASGADYLLEAYSGTGLIERAFSSNNNQQQIQQSMQAAEAAQASRGASLTAPNIPSQGPLSREQVETLENYTQSLAVRLGELQMQGLDQRNAEYKKLLEEMVNNTARVEQAIKALDR